jgi:hypothetical protein
MRHGILLILVISLIGCRHSKEASIFEPKCFCEKVNFNEGSIFQDSLKNYSISTFDSWIPKKFLIDNHSQIIMGDSTNGHLSGIGVDMHQYKSPWNWSKEVKNMTEYIDVVNYGQIRINGDSLFWIDVEEFQPYMKTRSITKIIADSNNSLSVSLVTNDSVNPNIRLCEMERILETIEIKK